MTMKTEFRRIDNSEIDEAYSIVCQRTDWLNSTGLKQWTEPLPKSVFDNRQKSGQNFGLFCNDQLVVFLSLVKESIPYWQKEIGNADVWWLTTLASSIDFLGKNLGETAVGRAINFLKGKNVTTLYLDCVEGFLPMYYGRIGFKKIIQKDIDFPKCGLSHMVLMKYNILG
jgi:hypothetical protein